MRTQINYLYSLTAEREQQCMRVRRIIDQKTFQKRLNRFKSYANSTNAFISNI